MAKRSLDTSSPSDSGPERQIPRRTERSHEENQERAYIAASRRADRSLEARIQSARMASEIHKKRTGKGFKITEEIVMKEEMYEEEEDELPRHYRAFAAHLQTTSPDMNSRLNAYVTNHVTLASLARHQEIDRLFAEQFPMAAKAFQYQAPQGHPSQPMHLFPNFNLGGPTYSRERTHSVPDITSPLSPYQQPYAGYNSPSTRHASIDTQLSPITSCTSGSGTLRTVSTPATNYSSEDSSSKPQFSTAIPVDPSLTMSALLPDEPTTSSFTSELSHETKLLVGDINQQMVSALYGGELMGSEDYFTDPHHSVPFCFAQPYTQPAATQESPLTSLEYPETKLHGTHLGPSTQGSTSGTPNPHVDFDQWLEEPTMNR